MFKTASNISLRLTRKSQPQIFSRTLRAYSTPAKNMEGFKKAGNRADAPPKHEMVHFPGLMSEKRSFGDFRTVLHTGLYSQIVAMEVPVGGDIGDEVHTVDQILLFTSGRGLATVAGKDQEVKAGDVVVVPAGTQHQFVTKGDQPLELITVYSPAEHLPTSVHKTKEEGDKAEDDEIDEAPEWALKPKAENEKSGEVREDAKY
ncbi:RmlC-like cupin [Dothidotthia symphoricarpi CBS 119687]|uniref:RmlC-like cupin n=1 Tax=Dothidotthia symphoricarpi CBS 119687 TaxID=1392245 RepID=A0A6A6AUZ1_9PLEO|nr:RmlC-like cupin [Dothidotthia symphoricarpi CBS 119687]KAF2134687.1 RmlC-like cupin [Dothidotthia symphoricarpi CBS 119687]